MKSERRGEWMAVSPRMLSRDAPPEMALTPSAGSSVSEERVRAPHCASARVKAEVRRDGMADISRVSACSSEVVSTDVCPSMALTVFFVSDTPVMLRVGVGAGEEREGEEGEEEAGEHAAHGRGEGDERGGREVCARVEQREKEDGVWRGNGGGG